MQAEKTENVHILNSYGNGFYPEMEEPNIIEKSADSAIWYPAIITSLLVGKRTKKYSDRFTSHISDQNNTRHSLRTELRVARTIGIVVGCFTVCWLPFTVIYILQVEFLMTKDSFNFNVFAGFSNVSHRSMCPWLAVYNSFLAWIRQLSR